MERKEKSYEVVVTHASWELSGREKVKMRDNENFVKLDQSVSNDGEKLLIDVAGYARLHVRNDRTKLGNPEYDLLVIRDKESNLYCTGSECCDDNFTDIWTDMEGEWEEEGFFTMYFKKVPSSIKDKYAIICGLV